MKIKTSELSGIALDWAVDECEGDGIFVFRLHNGDLVNHCPYSSDWSQGGPIIERERMDIIYNLGDMEYQATIHLKDEYSLQYGQTPLIAAMRCYVASKLGEEVEIPDELVKEG